MSADLQRKLGLQPGQIIAMLEVPEPEAGDILEACPPGASVLTGLDNQPFHQIFFWPHSLPGLVQSFERLQAAIFPHGAIWAVMPKKKYAAGRGVDFSWETLQAAALHTDLVDNKIVSINSQAYATRFVIRKDRRSRTTSKESQHGN